MPHQLLASMLFRLLAHVFLFTLSTITQYIFPAVFRCCSVNYRIVNGRQEIQAFREPALTSTIGSRSSDRYDSLIPFFESYRSPLWFWFVPRLLSTLPCIFYSRANGLDNFLAILLLDQQVHIVSHTFLHCLQMSSEIVLAGSSKTWHCIVSGPSQECIQLMHVSRRQSNDQGDHCFSEHYWL